jgi:hypothetical protein
LSALLLRRHSLRDLRWEWEQRTAASAEPTANATLAPANETITTSNQQAEIWVLNFLIKTIILRYVY